MSGRRKLVVGVILGILLPATGIPIWVAVSIAQARPKMERLVRDLHAELRARDPHRRPITGQATEGNAWDDYEEAFRSQTHALDALHRGAHRSKSITPIPWELGYEGLFPYLNEAFELVKLAQRRAYDLLLKEGKPGEAAQVLLDACQFIRDYGYNTTWTTADSAAELFSPATDALKAVIVSPATSPAELRMIARALGDLEASEARGSHLLMREALTIGYGHLREWDTPQSDALKEISPGWRHLWSARLQIVSGYERFVSICRGAREPASSRDRARIQNELLSDPDAEQNPLIVRWLELPFAVGDRLWRARSQLRILRIAAHWRANGELLNLADPLGATFVILTTPAKIKITGQSDFTVEVSR